MSSTEELITAGCIRISGYVLKDEAVVSLIDEVQIVAPVEDPVAGFTNEAVAAWAKEHIAPGSAVFSDGLACFAAVTEAGCTHHPTVMAGRKPKDVLEFKWINTVLGNLKPSSSFHQ